jgi:hypothetical protein
MTDATTAQSSLASATSTVQDLVDALEVRVARAAAEITELQGLINGAGTDADPFTGDLYEAW